MDKETNRPSRSTKPVKRREVVKQMAKLAGLGIGLASLVGQAAAQGTPAGGKKVKKAKKEELVKITKTTGPHPPTKPVESDTWYIVEVKLTPEQVAEIKAKSGKDIKSIRIMTFDIDRLSAMACN